MLEPSSRTDVRDLFLERHAFLHARPLFDQHRRTFFVPQLDLWAEQDHREAGVALYWARDQLLAVWAQTCLDQEAGRQAYDEAMRSGLYDAANEVWLENILPKDDSYRADPSLHAELLATLIELEFDIDRGRLRYERIRSSGEASRTFTGTVGADVAAEGFEGSDSANVTEHLLVALIELSLGYCDARRMYERLKSGGSYDRTRREWRNPRSDQRTSYAQLLGVLCEWMTDRISGCERYCSLLKTSLYDAHQNEWHHAIHPTHGVTARCYTMPHLLDVVIRAGLDVDHWVSDVGGSPPQRLHLG